MNERHSSSAKEIMRSTVDEEIIAADNYFQQSEDEDEREGGGEHQVRESEIPFTKEDQGKRDHMELEEIIGATVDERLLNEEDDDGGSDPSQRAQVERARNIRDSRRKTDSGEFKINFSVKQLIP